MKNEPKFELIQASVDLNRKELDKWQQARRAFLSPDFPAAHLLVGVYNDAMLDAHLSAIVQNRTLRLQSKQYILRDAKGEPQPELSALLSHQWFNTAIQAFANAMFYGFSLIQINPQNPVNPLNPVKIEIVPPQHVLPQRRLLLAKTTDTDGYKIDDHPQWLILIQNHQHPLGILEKAVPLTIFKRHSWSAWERFEQLFGVPLRVIKAYNQPPEVEAKLIKALDDMGSAASAKLPKDVDLEIIQTNTSDAFGVFQNKLSFVNSELSKLINGQTMTVDSGSSRSQSEVHLATEDQITQADIRNLCQWATDSLFPTLALHGIKLTGYSLDVLNQTNLSERIKIDSEIMRSSGYQLDKEYIEDTYGVKLSEKANDRASGSLSENTDYHFFA